MISFVAILAGVNEQMQEAQNALSKREFGRALKIYNEILESPNPPVTAYYFRGNALEGQRKLEEAVKDYARALDLSTGATKSMHERAQQRIAELCVANCHLDCLAKLGNKYFQYQTIQVLQQQQQERPQVLQSADETTVQKFAAVCRRDPAIQLRVLLFSIKGGNFTKIRSQLDGLKGLLPNGKYEIQQLTELFALLESLVNEEYVELEKTAGRLSKQNPDEPAFGHLIKLSKGLAAAFEQFTKLTPNSQKLANAEMQQLVSQAGKLRDLPQKVFQRLGSRLAQQISSIFQVAASDIPQIDFGSAQKAVEGQIRTIDCAVQLLQNKTAEKCEHELKSPAAKYLKALVLALPMNNEIKELSKQFGRGEDIADQVEDMDRRYAVIVQMLTDCSKVKGDPFPNIEKFVDEINTVLDKIFALQTRISTPDPYKMLNVSRGSTASDIKKSYFKLAKVNHPDMIPKDASEQEKKARNRKFQQIAEAYDILSDEQKRKQFDSGNLGQDEKMQAQNLHAQRKERAKMQVSGEDQQMRGGGQQFMHFQGGQDPFQFFQQFGGFNFNFGGGGNPFGGQQQQQGQRQGGQRQGQRQQGGQRQQQQQQGRQRIIFNGQEFFI